MRAGELVDDRFEIEREAGAGGMGIVYRARDLRDGSSVAVKVLSSRSGVGVSRFAREAEVLAHLSHPAIVRYVTHGVTARSEPYLVMEWLDGEDLAQRLTRGALSIADSVALGTRIAAAVGAAHALGFVHRDLKPSNVFLEGGALDRPKLLDFGLARELSRSSDHLTKTGAVLGTVGYLSPEQARGSAELDARTDVFSLGCMLFECLVGQAAFSAPHEIATLAKLLIEDVPRVRTLRPDVPGALDSLIARMLEKNRDARPRDGLDVADVLASLSSRDTISPPNQISSPFAAALTALEQRVMAVILVAQRGESEPGSADVTTPGDVGAATQISLRSPAARQRIGEIMQRFEAASDVAADGTVVVTLRIGGAAIDQATHAARCALALGAACPGAVIALALGRGVSESGLAAGEVIEHAAALLAAARGRRTEGVHIEASLAALVEDRFALTRDGGALLHGERHGLGVSRGVLGRMTPFVGRTREITLLEQTLTECAFESTANAVLVVAPAGTGKSRLLEEFLKSVRRRQPDATVWPVGADALRVESELGVIASFLRWAAEVPESAGPEQLRAALAALTTRCEEGARERIELFLAEVLGCPYADDASLELRAARQSHQLMRDQIARAWTDLVGAVLADGPMLLCVEDLHWADLSSVRLLDTTLRVHANRPLAVLALGRPELFDRLGPVWADRGAQIIRLNPLSPRAATELARRALGEASSEETAGQLAERSGGNPFVLEELVRARAAGATADELPDTVLALVQTRLEAQGPVHRRTLRAASIFGRVASENGVAKLLGEDATPETTRASLRWLVEREFLEPVREGAAFAFRHDLIRDAAYAMLTPADRQRGHLLAAEWLVANDETDAGVLALHFERGGELERAAEQYTRAAEQALEADAFATTSLQAERALATGATGATRARAKLAWATARRWSGAHDEAIEAALDAAAGLEAGTDLWFTALRVVASAADVVGRVEALTEAVDAALGQRPATTEAAVTRLAVLTIGADGWRHRGDLARSEALSQRVESEAKPLLGEHPLVVAAIYRLHTARTAHAGDVAAALAAWQRVVEAYEAAGDRRYACASRMNMGFVMLQLGLGERAERVLRTALSDATAMDLREIAAGARHNLGLALLRRGAIDAAIAEEAAAVQAFESSGNHRLAGGSRTYLSIILQAAGDLPGAERAARLAIEDLTTFPSIAPHASAQLANVLLARGRAVEALEYAERAMNWLKTGPVDDGEALVRLVFVDALRAAGRSAEAAAALRAAAAELRARALCISDEALREHFLRDVPENARTLALAAELDAPG